MIELRWIKDPPMDGPDNMARDHALLQQVGRGLSQPTLRFYRWSTPTISLGYFQKYADYTRLSKPAGNLPVVRRITGGGAIIHHMELTYSLTLSLNHHLITAKGPNALYHHVHAVFAAFLEDHGLTVISGPDPSETSAQPPVSDPRSPFFCFERHTCFDLMANGKKLMGSAQRRTKNAVLQHGSLIIANRFEQQKCTTVDRYVNIDIDKQLHRIADMIAGMHAGPPKSWEPKEIQLARQLREKYTDPQWTQRR